MMSVSEKNVEVMENDQNKRQADVVDRHPFYT